MSMPLGPGTKLLGTCSHNVTPHHGAFCLKRAQAATGAGLPNHHHVPLRNIGGRCGHCSYYGRTKSGLG